MYTHSHTHTRDENLCLVDVEDTFFFVQQPKRLGRMTTDGDTVGACVTNGLQIKKKDTSWRKALNNTLRVASTSFIQ